MSNKVYDVLKWVCIIVAPAICTLLVALNSLWNWGLPIEAITGTITGIATFIGGILGISSVKYKKTEGGE
jgi:hypothetical protein